LRYLAPEQARGESLSPAADIYAVGVILHEMLTGAPPFADESLLAAANRDRHAVPRVDALRPDVSPPVVDAVAKALAPNPADRFDSAEAMIVALGSATAPVAHAAAAGAIAAAPVGVAAEAMATRIQPLAATQVMPHGRTVGSTGRSRAIVIFAALCLVGIAGIAIAARDDPSAGELVAATDDSTAATASEPAPTTPATDAATTTIAVTTTVAPTTTTLPPVAELVPGFPLPADLESFLAQLTADPSVVGNHGGEIERDLRHMLEEKSPRKQSDQAGKLIDHLEEWRDNGSLHPAVTDFLIPLIAPFDDRDGDDDD
jgi:hypothetical protein